MGERSMLLQIVHEADTESIQGPYPFMYPRVLPLVRELRRSLCTTSVCEGDDIRNSNQDDDDGLRRIFNIVLNDCASLQCILAVDHVDRTRTPTESFLCTLVRNALCTNRPELRIKCVSAYFCLLPFAHTRTAAAKA